MQPVYFIPCLLSLDTGYMSGVDCTVKRNWVRVTLTENIVDSTTFEILLVGIRNPNTLDAQTFNILVMEADSETDELMSNKADQYYYTTYTLGAAPAAFIDLLNVTIDYKDGSNALAAKDSYEFWFTVFADGTTAKTVTVRANVGKFLVTFPD